MTGKLKGGEMMKRNDFGLQVSLLLYAVDRFIARYIVGLNRALLTRHSIYAEDADANAPLHMTDLWKSN